MHPRIVGASRLDGRQAEQVIERLEERLIGLDRLGTRGACAGRNQRGGILRLDELQHVLEQASLASSGVAGDQYELRGSGAGGGPGRFELTQLFLAALGDEERWVTRRGGDGVRA